MPCNADGTAIHPLHRNVDRACNLLMPPRFFVPQPLAGSVDATIALPDDVARHATRVLRLQAGDTITLFDGHGGEYRATIVAGSKRETLARIDAHDAVERESPLAITLVQAIIAADAMDYAIRKAVELGVTSIVPVMAARSQGAGDGARADKRLAHWRAIAVAACEQCGRNRVPPVDAPRALSDWLRAPLLPAVVAQPLAAESLAAFAARTPPRAVVVGPEGGLDHSEIAQASRAGVTAVHLGARVLRAETAAVAALAMLAAVAGDAR